MTRIQKLSLSGFWYGTPELNASVVVMTVKEKDMSHQRKQANAEGGAVVLVVVTHPTEEEYLSMRIFA